MTIKGKLVGAILISSCAIGVLLSGCSGYNPPSTTSVPTSQPAATQTTTAAQPTSSKVPPATTPLSAGNTPASDVAQVSGSQPAQANIGDESLIISVDKQQVNPGDTFNVNVIVNSKAASRGAQCSLNFDASAMKCNGVVEGDFYKVWAGANGVKTTMMPPEPTIDNIKGTVEMTAVAIMGQTKAEQEGSSAANGPKGRSIFLSYKMTAIPRVNKQAAIKLSNIGIADGTGAKIKEVDTVNGQITIGKP